MVVTTLINLRPDLLLPLWKIAQQYDLSFSNFIDAHVIVKNSQDDADDVYVDASEKDAQQATEAWYSDAFKPLDKDPVKYTKQKEADFYSFNAFVIAA